MDDIFPGSGRSCVSPDGKLVVVSNMYDGVDFYSISTHAFSHTVIYRVNPHMNSPIPVEFLPDGRAILIGGTYGSARMVDAQTSETIQLLPHSGECGLQLWLHTLSCWRRSHSSIERSPDQERGVDCIGWRVRTRQRDRHKSVVLKNRETDWEDYPTNYQCGGRTHR